MAKNPHAPDAMCFQRSSTSSPPNPPNNSLGLGSIPNKIFGIHVAAMSLQVLRCTCGRDLVYTEGLGAATVRTLAAMCSEPNSTMVAPY